MSECSLDTEVHVLTYLGGLLPNPNTVTSRFQALLKNLSISIAQNRNAIRIAKTQLESTGQ
jgi:hypothetical protein